jgi:hypothetical protein
MKSKSILRPFSITLLTAIALSLTTPAQGQTRPLTPETAAPEPSVRETTPPETAPPETFTSDRNVQGYACYASPDDSRTPTTYAIWASEDDQNSHYSPIIRWTYTGFVNFTPRERCEQVSNRLDRYHKAERLRYITSGSLNNYNVIYGAAYKSEAANSDNLILTLVPGEDPNIILNDFLNAGSGASGPITRSSKKWVPMGIVSPNAAIEVPMPFEDEGTEIAPDSANPDATNSGATNPSASPTDLVNPPATTSNTPSQSAPANP